jgi:opacity protein-like surface antigen
MMKSLGTAAACLLIASAAVAQVQRASPGSDGSNHVGTGYSQTQHPQAVAPAAGPTRVYDNNAPGSAGANNAAVGHAHSLAQPTAPSVATEPEPPQVIDNNTLGSSGANNVTTGYQSTKH